MTEVDDVSVLVGRRTTVRFHDCIAVQGEEEPFSMPGDAGALVWRIEDAMAVGVIFAAGNRTDEQLPVTFLLPLDPILKLFELSMA